MPNFASPLPIRKRAPASPSTTVKRLQPGVPGTKRLLERFGQALVCVRYRVDTISGRRFTTVELVVEERAAKTKSDAWVRVAYNETELRNRVKNAGGVWDATRKLWSVPAQAVKVLGLEKRAIKDIQ